MAKNQLFPSKAEGLFSPAEYRLLFHYFRNDDAYEGLKADLADILEEDAHPSMQKAVGRITFKNIEARLPRWLAHNKEGEAAFRGAVSQSNLRDEVLAGPVLLSSSKDFEAGPKKGLKHDTYVVYVPLFNRFVVTECDNGQQRSVAHFTASYFFDNTRVSWSFLEFILNVLRWNSSEPDSGSVI